MYSESFNPTILRVCSLKPVCSNGRHGKLLQPSSVSRFACCIAKCFSVNKYNTLSQNIAAIL
jgi:hypothetical protein